jgi:regulator of protease activity HflC (stomatin/prohibitin superfamily)
VTEIVSWTATVIVVALIAAFIVALFSLRQMPLAKRPVTPIFDRLGRQIGMTENPDYHANPGEDPAQSPDQPPKQ